MAETLVWKSSNNTEFAKNCIEDGGEMIGYYCKQVREHIEWQIESVDFWDWLYEVMFSWL